MKQAGAIQKLGVALVLILLLCPLNAAAQVSSTREPTGPQGSVYVAGNPDLYPLEYYDAEHRCYAGVMPELLKRISDETGVDFTYVCAGVRDQRARLAQNNQVELVSGLLAQDEAVQYARAGRTLLHITLDGTTYAVSFGYTDIATDALRKAVEDTLAQMEPMELAGLTVSVAAALRQSPLPFWARLAMIVFAFLSLGWAVFSGCLIVRRKRRPRVERLVAPLTGVGNGAYFLHHFQNSITEITRPLYHIFYIGYDFSSVQARYGEQEAEDLLRYVADVLSQQAGDTDFFGHIGSGCFALAAQCVNRDKAVELAELLLHRIESYRDKFQKDYNPDARIGLYALRKEDTNCETAIYNAQQGYRSAREQNLPYVVSDEAFLKQARELEALRRQILHAIEVHEFKCYLHVMTEFNGGRIFAAEVLSRWMHPEYGLLMPRKYISDMEQTGAISALDWYMIEATCRLLERTEREIGSNFQLFCKVSTQTFAQPGFFPQLETVVSRYRFSRGLMGLEVTERTLFGSGETALENARQCHAAGFRLILDGTGSGYISFSKMMSCDIDMVKFDREVLLQAARPRGKKLLCGLNDFFHSMDVATLCEGVEVESQYRLAQELGLDYVQGFYIQKPLPVREAVQWLKEEGLQRRW